MDRIIFFVWNVFLIFRITLFSFDELFYNLYMFKTIAGNSSLNNVNKFSEYARKRIQNKEI